ncbi:MAG: hypothetical protein ACRD9L_24200, partial [Bryobacteraceae bacterium]
HRKEKLSMLQEIPPDEQLMNVSVEPSVLPSERFIFQGLIWPSQEALNGHASKFALADFELVDDTLGWIGRILTSEWVAPDLRARLRAASGIAGRRDAFLTRYAINGTKVQIVVTRFFVYIVIVPSGALAGGAQGVLHRCLRVDQPGDKAPWTGEPWSIAHIQGFTYGYQPRSDFSDWRDSINYLTNGRAVKFSVQKTETVPPGSGGLKTGFAPTEESETHWFEQRR